MGAERGYVLLVCEQVEDEGSMGWGWGEGGENERRESRGLGGSGYRAAGLAGCLPYGYFRRWSRKLGRGRSRPLNILRVLNWRLLP